MVFTDVSPEVYMENMIPAFWRVNHLLELSIINCETCEELIKMKWGDLEKTEKHFKECKKEYSEILELTNQFNLIYMHRNTQCNCCPTHCPILPKYNEDHKQKIQKLNIKIKEKYNLLRKIYTEGKKDN